MGALFHALRGGSGWRLLLYLGLSTLGFVLGQVLKIISGWSLFRFGVLDLGLGMLGSLLILAAGGWLIRTK
jgi:hypothetical protein